MPEEIVLQDGDFLRAQTKWYSRCRPRSSSDVAASAYLGLLVAEYEGLDPREIRPENQPLYQELRQELVTWRDNSSGKEPEWIALCALEVRLLRLLSVNALRVKLPLVRARLYDLVSLSGDGAKDKETLAGADLDENLLREYAKQIVSEFHFHCQIRWQREQLRVHSIRFACYGLGAVLVLAIIVSVVSSLLPVVSSLLPVVSSLLPVVSSLSLDEKRGFGSFIPVLFMGAIGGFVSIYLKMQAVDLRTKEFSSLLALQHGWWSIVLAPVFGAVFGGLLFLLFACDFIQGPLFPQIRLPYEVNYHLFFLETHPDLPIDLVKLLIWSFVAGFAERLVPNVLNRLTVEMEKAPGK